MDFADESYVRLYTRDSTSWLRLSWEARALLCFLLRKVDRVGVLDGLTNPVDDLALHVGMPPAVVDRALGELLDSGAAEWIVTDRHGMSRLVLPRFLEAQTCGRSDRLRQQEARQRRRETARKGPSVTVGHDLSRPVTDRPSDLSFTDLIRSEIPPTPQRSLNESSSAAQPQTTQGPTVVPGNAVSGADVDPGLSEEGSQVSRPVWHTLKGWQEPSGFAAELLAAGITRSVFDRRLAELSAGPIGGKRGVFDRTDYIRLQLPKWRAWEETEAARGPKRRPELDGGGVWTLSPRVKQYGTVKCELSDGEVTRLAQVYRDGEDWHGRTKADADKRFASRLAEVARARALTRELGLRKAEPPEDLPDSRAGP